MSENHRVTHRSFRTDSSINKNKDKENITESKKSSIELLKNENKTDVSTAARNVLRSKSTNCLKVSSSSLSSSKYLKEYDNKFTQHINNTNKARKIIKQPFIFDTKTNEDNFRFHDSTTLQRSQSQTQQDKFKDAERNNLSRSSTFGSSFNSSLTFNSKITETRKIKSQLTIGAEKGIADFFKKSKIEEQQQLGLIDKDDIDYDNNIEELTFADENGDISSMKKIETERNSPLYERTHKVSLHTLLSSSTGSDDIEETTFDYKDNETKIQNKKSARDLEKLIITTNTNKSRKDEKYDDLEIEITSHKTNGNFNDDDLPDSLEGMYRPMSTEILTNLWGKPTSASIEAAEKFADPLELKNTWNNTDKKNVLSLNLEEMQKPDKLNLEFSDEEINYEDLDESKDNSLDEIMQFYEKKVSY